MLWPNTTAAGYREAAHRWNVGEEEAAAVKNDDGRYRQELCPPGGCNHHHRPFIVELIETG